jgi:hypothetical protein
MIGISPFKLELIVGKTVEVDENNSGVKINGKTVMQGLKRHLASVV